MIITCPQCATRYETADDAFTGEGRKVKCTGCGNIWLQKPLEEMAADEPAGMAAAEEPAEEAADDAFEDAPEEASEEAETNVLEGYLADWEEAAEVPESGDEDIVDIESEAQRLASASRRASAEYAERRAERSAATRGWGKLAACIAVFVVGGYFFQVPIVKQFPAAAALYAQIGLEVNIRGLEFRNLTYKREFENGIPVLAIKGEVVNITGDALKIPRLRFGLLDQVDQEIYHWSMQLKGKPIEPNQGVPFTTRLAAPPAAARHVQVMFAKGAI